MLILFFIGTFALESFSVFTDNSYNIKYQVKNAVHNFYTLMLLQNKFTLTDIPTLQQSFQNFTASFG